MLSNALTDDHDWPSPPGQTILSILEFRELTLEDFAQQIGKNVSFTQKLIDGTNVIDMELARKLASTLGSSANFWMAREHDYRLSVSKPNNIDVSSLTDLLAKLPLDDMTKFGWIKPANSKDDQINNCLDFFGISSLAQWIGRYDDTFQSATFRKSTKIRANEIATTVWLRQGEILTSKDKVEEWSPKILKEQLPRFRRLSWYKHPKLFLPIIKHLFAKSGVKFAVVRAPKGCNVSGAVRLTNDGVPHVQLSFRYLADDQFWFSLFHEIGHLLLHYDRMPFFEISENEKTNFEREANDFAANVIVPIFYLEEFHALGRSRQPIISFAKKVGISPGLIVGQLQYKGIIGYNQMQHLKRRYRWLD